MRSISLLLAVLALSGCGRDDREPPTPAATLTPLASASLLPTAPATSAPAVLPQPSAAAGDPAWNVPTDPRDPATLVARWRQALETHDYAAARDAFGHGGADSGLSADAFAATWDKYRIIDITVGKGEQEGAAGSLYYEAPVTITGLTRDGTPYHLAGTITLRRVNDVDGASAEQLAWHIERSTLQP